MCNHCADLDATPGGPSFSERATWPHEPVAIVRWFYDAGAEPPENVVRAAISGTRWPQ